jgi:hypothetical protein
MASFTLQSFYTWGKSSQQTVDRTCGPQIWFGHGKEETNASPAGNRCPVFQAVGDHGNTHTHTLVPIVCLPLKVVVPQSRNFIFIWNPRLIIVFIRARH